MPDNKIAVSEELLRRVLLCSDLPVEVAQEIEYLLRGQKGPPVLASETRQQYCDRMQRENDQADGLRKSEQRRREALEARFGAQLDRLPADELDALVRVALPEFGQRFFFADRSRARSWLVRGPLLIALSRMAAAAAREAV